MMVRICWKSNATGAEGHGLWLPDSYVVRLYLDQARAAYPNLDHWLEFKEA